MKIGSKKGAELRRAIGDLLLWLLLTACPAGALLGYMKGH